MLSPTFRVREFKVEDSNPYPINLVWKDLDSESMETEEYVVGDDPTETPSPHNPPPFSFFFSMFLEEEGWAVRASSMMLFSLYSMSPSFPLS
jgi:hypothetical protein